MPRNRQNSFRDFREHSQAVAANVVDLARIRADRAFEHFFAVTYPQRVRQRATRLREFLAEIERAADAGAGLDWIDAITLPHFEEAMQRELALRARAEAWARGRRR
jgi:hypothetical protein